MADFWDDIGAALKGVVPVVATVAPTIATALGGPLAGMAVQALSRAILGTPDGSAAQVATALASATPDQLVALKREEHEFATKTAELELEWGKINQSDRASARDREVKAGDSFTPRMLAVGVTGGFFGILAWVLVRGIPPAGGDAVLLLLGSLGTAWTGIVSYYFGSSAGSADKTAQLASLARPAPAPPRG